MAQPIRQLDTHFEMVTPENIAFQYRVAGPFQRLPAYLLDLIFQAAILISGFMVLVFAGALASLPGVGGAVWLVLWFFLTWFYGGFFETVLNGQTPGKRLLRLRVISTDGQPINALQAILRNMLRGADMLPTYTILYTYQVGLLSAVLTERFQRLGDLTCGTMVVVEEPQYRYGVAQVTEPNVLALAAEIPAGFVVSRSLAQALSSYVLRRSAIPWSRRLQIARHVGEPLRERFGLPPGTNYDHLLCAVYQRAFFGTTEAPVAVNPFRQATPANSPPGDTAAANAPLGVPVAIAEATTTSSAPIVAE